MLLPRERTERHAFYRNIIREIELASREDRKAVNRRLRGIYLSGSDTSSPAVYNRIKEHVLDSTADLYQPESVRFGVAHPQHYGEQFMLEDAAARDDLHRIWLSTEAALLAGSAVEWAHVYPSTVVKVFVDQGEAALDLIADPSDIGVYRESVHSWDRQEAICHWYDADLATFRRMIAAVPDREKRENMWALATEHAGPSRASDLAVLGNARQLVLSATSPNLVGSAARSAPSQADPKERADVVRMCELWIWDDQAIELCDACGHTPAGIAHRKGPLHHHDFRPGAGWAGDYRVVTHFIETEDVLWDPINPLIPGEHPFHGLTLDFVPGYIWGLSQIENLYPLQVEREIARAELDEATGRNLDPAIVAVGVSGVMEERIGKLRKRGGSFVVSQAGSTDVKPFVFAIPPEAEQRIERIDKEFDRASGRRSRQREPGQRSGDQVLAEAMLNGGPTLSKAMRVEAWLGGVATSLLRLHRIVNGQTLKKSDGTDFLLAQVPGDFEASVSAHSHSPLYAERLMAKIAFAAQHKAIDKDHLLHLLQLPESEMLEAYARHRAKGEAEMQKKVVELKEEEAKAKVVKALK